MKGLILSGGRSSRMGQDKGKIVYPLLSPLPIAEHLRNLALRFCGEVYFSLRAGQSGPLPRIDDEGAGPAGALIAAHRFSPDSPWLILACDFPFLDEKMLEQLMSRRDSRGAATCFLQKDGRPEPFCTIWEATSLRELAASGEDSPRRILERLGATTIAPPPGRLANVNSFDEALALGLQ